MRTCLLARPSLLSCVQQSMLWTISFRRESLRSCVCVQDALSSPGCSRWGCSGGHSHHHGLEDSSLLSVCSHSALLMALALQVHSTDRLLLGVRQRSSSSVMTALMHRRLIQRQQRRQSAPQCRQRTHRTTGGNSGKGVFSVLFAVLESTTSSSRHTVHLLVGLSALPLSMAPTIIQCGCTGTLSIMQGM